MKSKLLPIMFAMPLTTGICGAILRISQFKYAYNANAEILTSAVPSTYGFLAVCTIAALMALIAAFLLKNGIEINSDKASSLASFSLFAAAIVFLAHAGITLFLLRDKFEVIKLILAFFSIYSAVSFLVLGKYRLNERDSTAYCIFSAVPVFWACFMLVILFREKISDPVISNYASLIFSYVLILFFSYALSAYVLGKSRNSVAVFSSFFGIYFILVELISSFYLNAHLLLDLVKVCELLPLLAFFILMAGTIAHITKK